MKKDNIIKIWLTILVVFLCFFSNYFLSWLFDTISFLKNSSQSIILVIDIIFKLLAYWILCSKLIDKKTKKSKKENVVSTMSTIMILAILISVAFFDVFNGIEIRLFFEIKNYDLLYLMLRTVYNVLYVLNMVLFIECIDKIILKFKNLNDKIPYSGIILGLIRAVPFLLATNYIMSIRAVIVSILFGLTYILLNRNRNLSYVVVLMMFYL